MIRHVIAFAVAGALAAAPCSAAELIDTGQAATARNGAQAGAYFRLPLGRTSAAERAPRAGLRLAFTRISGDIRSFSMQREANLFDLRFASSRPAGFYIADRPVAGGEADRLNAEGESKGRLDKIMIGAGVALGAVAAFFVVSSVSG